MKMQRTLTASLALLIISASGLAAAGPEKKEKRDKDVLRGPEVTQTTTTTTTDRPSDSMKDRPDRSDRPGKADRKGKGQANHPITFRDYQLAIRQLKNKRAAQALNLTDDQQAQIRTIFQEHRQAMQAFLEEHKDKIAEMRQRIKQGKADQQKGRSAIEPANKGNKQGNKQGNRASQAREKLSNFISNAPANKEALAKLEKVLTPAQFDALKSHIKSTRAKRANRPGQSPRNKAQRDQRGNQGGAQEKQDRTQTDRPNTHRRKMNRDRVTNTGKKDARRDKPSKEKPSQGSPTDDNGIFSEAPDEDDC